jgi:hypothetical protein
MAYTDLALPIDIPWKRLAASSDMMDRQRGDVLYPAKWRSSISVFYHEPGEIPESYCERKVTYLKIVCSITGYQAGAEVGLATRGGDAYTEHESALGDAYYACYAATLQVAVFPNSSDEDPIPLADFPYIVDFEPKRRELYEAVTESGEILGRSTSALNLRKSTTSADSTEYASKIGAEVKAGFNFIGGVEATVSGEHSWGGGTHEEEQNVNTTDESREKRETYAASTNLTQMYELFNAYHLGTNRALFIIFARPHAVQQKDEYTFINGPRRLEGIQEVFLVVNRPKEQEGICVEAILETAHLSPEAPSGASAPLSGTTPITPSTASATYTQLESPPVTMFGLWGGNRGNVGDTKDFEQVVFSLPAGCELDTTRPSPPQSFDVQSFGILPALTIRVDPGIVVDVKDDTFWASIQGVEATVSGGQVIAKVTLRNGGGNWPPRFNFDVTVFYRCPQVTPPTGGGPSPGPGTGGTDGGGTGTRERKLFLTARSISSCAALSNNEASEPASVPVLLDDKKVKDPEARVKLLEWAIDKRIIDLADLGIEDPEASLEDVIREAGDEVVRRLTEAAAQGRLDSVPAEFLMPEDWVSLEMPLAVPVVMSDPAATALNRIRSSNDISERIGRSVIESYGSGRRYPHRAVSYWETDMVLNRIGAEVAATGIGAPERFAIGKFDIPYQDRFIEAFGDAVTIIELAGLDVATLRAGLGVGDVEARRLKSKIIGLARTELGAASTDYTDDGVAGEADEDVDRSTTAERDDIR